MQNAIADNIEHYYFYQLDHLQESKKAHWLLRHYLWFQDDLSQTLLRARKDHYIFPSQKATIESYQKILSSSPEKTVKTHVSLRRKKRAKLLASDYPRLAKITTMLFKALFAYTIYDTDHRDLLPRIIPKEEILALRKKLLENPDHIRSLSTPAINFLYITEWAYGCKREHPKTYLEIGQNYTEKDFVLNTLYLLTHCIIGESRFYSRKIRYNKSVYVKMLVEIDRLLQQHFKELPLDIKTESLLCARLLAKPLEAEKRIQYEISRSMKQKPYLIDRFNFFRKKSSRQLSASEHRNVLYVMAMNPIPRQLDPKG